MGFFLVVHLVWYSQIL